MFGTIRRQVFHHLSDQILDGCETTARENPCQQFWRGVLYGLHHPHGESRGAPFGPLYSPLSGGPFSFLTLHQALATLPRMVMKPTTISPERAADLKRMRGSQPLWIRVTKEEHQQVKLAAVKRGLPIAGLMRFALEKIGVL